MSSVAKKTSSVNVTGQQLKIKLCRSILARITSFQIAHTLSVKKCFCQLEISQLSTLDRVFSANESNADVYRETTLPLVQSAVGGFNGMFVMLSFSYLTLSTAGTVFAYGQTSSGKTHTVMGVANDVGIIFHAVEDLFGMIEQMPERIFLLRVSYMEIYNEVVLDLLSGKARLGVHENANGEVFVSGLHEEVITNINEVYDVIAVGEQKRHFATTDINEHSSRSHAIFRIIIESRRCEDGLTDKEQSVLVSQLNIVDLAGAERAKSTTATGDRLKEGCAINRSLFMLSQVISKLSEQSALNATDMPYIGFRDSKLTRILQPALGGNSKTAIICTVTPAAREETLCTIKFAQRAKLITTKPIKNEVVNDRAMLKRYQKEIESLQQQVNVLTEASRFKALESEKDELNKKLREKEEKIRSLERLVCISTMSPSRNLLAKSNVNRRVSWCPGFSTRSPFSRLANGPIRPDDFNRIPFQLPPTPKVAFQSKIETLKEEEENEENLAPETEPAEGNENKVSIVVQLVDHACQTDECGSVAPEKGDIRDVSCLTDEAALGIPLLRLFDDELSSKFEFEVPVIDRDTVDCMSKRLEQMEEGQLELDTMRKQNNLLLAECNELKSEISLAESKRKSLEEHHAQQMDLHDKKIDELQNQLSQVQQQCECLQKEKNSLQSKSTEADKAQQEVLKLQEQIQMLNSSLDEKNVLLEKVAKEQENTLHEHKRQLSEKEELNTVLAERLKRLETDIQELSDKANQAVVDLTESDTKVNELNSRLKEVTAQCETLSNENKALILELNSKEEEKKKCIEQKLTEVHEKHEETLKLKKCVEDLESDLASAKSQLEDLANEHEIMLQKHNNEMSVKEELAAAMTEQIRQLESSNQELKEKATQAMAMESREKEICLLSSQKGELLKEIDQLKTELACSNAQKLKVAQNDCLVGELSSRLEKMQVDCTALSNENSRLTTKAADREEEVSFLYAKIDVQDREIERLEFENKEFEKRLNLQLLLLFEKPFGSD
ncbi:centromere associated protein E [Trichuris trichiura]|uniref:Centromere associated protein E n=1 Tax=Trichuris trichiura TaxID=36087 RepID=A0A077ZBU2_TRITR|nr:centromere associated protein E [Trichuris trichiura]